MKKTYFKPAVCVLFVTLVTGFWTLPLPASSAGPLDVMVKIGKLDEKLALINSLVPPNPDSPLKSPGFLAGSMLQGTQWIDSDRLIVIGAIMADPTPEMAIFIPYNEPNPNFQAAYNAAIVENGYLISLPPGSRPEGASEGMQHALTAASKNPYHHFLSFELAVESILSKSEAKIRESIAGIDEKGPTTVPNRPNQMSSHHLKEMMNQLMDVGRQVASISQGIDIDDEVIRFSFDAEAVDNSELGALFVRKDRLTLLNGYEPDEQISFRSGRYDLRGMIGLLEKVFGTFYAEMGIDLAALTGIMEHFTGESAGGMSLSGNRVQLEMVGVLIPETNAHFIKEIYLPWLEAYIQSITKALETQGGTNTVVRFETTPESNVAGRTVYGVRMAVPLPAGGFQNVSEASPGPEVVYNMRLAQEGECFIIAPDDDRMAELLLAVPEFKETVDTGPLFTMKMDWVGYLNAVRSSAGEGEKQNILPETGKMTLSAELDDGRLGAESAVLLSDIRTFVEMFKKSAASPPLKKAAASVSIRPKESIPDEKTETIMKDADYWTDRGVLSAVYGNDKAAVKFFEKAISLDPGKSNAHFHKAMALAGLGDMDKALEAVERAIGHNGRNATYVYGRGRIYLLDGQTEKALSDFKRAAEMGNQDAKHYISGLCTPPSAE
ncbi:MAG: tetratricopeptide repeat protein [Desulfobacterales bacterium]